jgi:exopolyphosphatase / guanosine-5'-triphosphate,3'-diphosphate pyrophosphatase
VDAVPVHKARRHFTIGGCMTEPTDLRTGDRSTRTIALESEEPARVIAAVRELGLGSRPNVSVPRELRALF